MTVRCQRVANKEDCYKDGVLGTLCEAWANWWDHWWDEIIIEYIKD